MRKPKPTRNTSGAEAPTPAGGRALGRAQQFTMSRGLPPPVVDTASAVKAAKPATPGSAAAAGARKAPRKTAKKAA